MVFPLFDFFKPIMLYPEEFKIYSLFYLFILLLSIVIMVYYGTETYKRAYKNMIYYKIANMDTLITLGSLSAMFMAIFFSILYQY